jgi:hypothetical protein
MPDRHYYTQRGEGRLKFLLTLLVIAVIAYVAMQFIPVYMRNLQMEDETQQIVSQAVVQNLREGDVRARLEEKASQYQLPDNKRIEITRNGKRLIVRVAYTKEIVLPFYTYPWSFDFRKEDTSF